MSGSHLVEEALVALHNQLIQPQPCVATASIVLGVLQERVFTQGTEQLEASVAALLLRFQELVVAPAAAKLAKCKTPQDKVVAIAKFLRGKLAKAPAHKQPLHTQYLPSALRDTGKRQLDCLGIATAVLAVCHQVATQWPQQHAALFAARMVVSDDHCWLAVPQQAPTAPPPTAAADAAGDSSKSQQQQQQQQQQDPGHLVYVEVTDPRVLNTSNMVGTWLYAGGHGMSCTSAQVLMVLVAGLMPEELSDDAAADRLRKVQQHLITQLSQQHPAALFYSNYFRWGMLHEEQELEDLAAAAEAAAASGDMAALQQLALLPPAQLQSQQHYVTSLQRSSGWQWHPCSCAVFGWLNRMQAALCAETDDLLVMQQQPQAGTAQAWLDIAVFLLQQALAAVSACTAVLRQYTGCAGKPDKAADTQLLEAVRDLWQNLADACKAVACLTQLQIQWEGQQQPAGQSLQTVAPCAAPMQLQQQQEQGPAGGSVEGSTSPAAAKSAPVLPSSPPLGADGAAEHTRSQQPQQQLVSSSSPGGHLGADVPASAAVPGHTVHLAAAVTKAAGGSGGSSLVVTSILGSSAWLLPQLELLDAVCCFFGEDSTDVPASVAADFVVVAGTFSPEARVQALQDGLQQKLLLSSRLQALAGSDAWRDLEPGLQQVIQMPGSRKRKRKE